MGRRMRANQRSSALPVPARPAETPMLSPSALLPEPVHVQEQPARRPEYACPAWPQCTASFRDEQEQRLHVRRHAHAQGR